MSTTTFLPCHITGKDLSISVQANMAAGVGGALYALSCVGPGQAIRAAAAAMRAGDRASFNIPLTTYGYYHGDGKFFVRYARLAYDHWHLLGLTVNPRFILNCTEEALWRLLQSQEFTTPLLRAWLPYIKHEMIRRGDLKKVDNRHACDPWFCTANDETLDAIVAEGVKAGTLKMEDSAI